MCIADQYGQQSVKNNSIEKELNRPLKNDDTPVNNNDDNEMIDEYNDDNDNNLMNSSINNNTKTKASPKRKFSSGSTGGMTQSSSNNQYNMNSNHNPKYNPNIIVNHLDDGLDTLTADEYVRIRLIPLVSEFTKDAPVLSRNVQIVTAIVIALSITSSIFSTFTLTSFIPLTIGFGESLTSWQSYRQTDMKVMQTNGALQQLHKVNSYRALFICISLYISLY